MKKTLTALIPNAEAYIKPLSKVTLLFSDGTDTTLTCAVSEKDFFTLWNKAVFTLKFPCGNDKYALIKKRKVVGFITEKA